MKEVTFHLDDGSHPIDQHIDDRTVPVTAFFTMAMVKANPPACQFLAFGNSDDIGRLLMSFYESDQKEGGIFASVMETVAEEIVRRKQSRVPWPTAEDGISH